MSKRFVAAMSVYCTMAVLAAFTLDGKLRIVIWIVMAYFAVRTYIAHRADR